MLDLREARLLGKPTGTDHFPTFSIHKTLETTKEEPEKSPSLLITVILRSF